MKIVDKETGKRVGKTASDKAVLKDLKETDPIKANANKDMEVSEFSPMDPPDAYEKSLKLEMDEAGVSQAIHIFMDEHTELVKEIDSFEAALNELKEGEFYISKEINNRLNTFFIYFDAHIIPHNRKEERYLFPILHKRLIESGEHSPGEERTTAVDLMEDDHIKFIQLASLTFNLLGLAIRFKDKSSQAVTFDLAYHNGKELVELLRLHVYREDHTLFPLAQKLLTKIELEEINRELHA